MARTRGSVVIDAERCTGCNICVELCPQHCLKLGEEVNSHDYRIAILAPAEDCTGCEICGWACPHWAIDVFRELKLARPAEGDATRAETA
jgi:2-oxoglutarate ferredoxin oxidoreductase subunit delta